MPVSKKRKKDGKPVHMHITPPGEAHAEEQHATGAEPKPGPKQFRVGKPSNPFVAQQTRKASQRGR
jgi:hypothetical protein